MAVKDFDKVKANYQKAETKTPKGPYSGTDNNTLAQLKALQQGKNKPLVLPDSDKIMLRGCQFTPVGLVIPDNLTEEDFVYVVREVVKLEAAIQWIVGDLWAFAERQYGERAELAEIFGKKPKTLSNWATVCRSFPDQSSRRRELSFSHYAEVAGHPDAENLLLRALDEGLSRNALRELIQGKPKKVDSWRQFENSTLQKAQKADSTERSQIASRLRRLADAIDSLG